MNHIREYPFQFRAWEHKGQVMLDWMCLSQTAFNREDYQLLYEVATDPNYRFVKMLFTGLKDKNNKPIYEGDIVTAWSEGSKGKFEVRWRQSAGPCWILYPAWRDGKFWYLHGSKRGEEWVDDGVEVIGNIYQNPDLRPEFTTE